MPAAVPHRQCRFCATQRHMASLSILSDNRAHVFGMRPGDLVAHLRVHSVSSTDAEARRVLGRLVSEGHTSLLGMKKPVSSPVRRAVEETCVSTRLRVVASEVDESDGFTKHLLLCEDGQKIEAVQIPLHQPGHYTVCVSSQVGCGMGCAFCATGRIGLLRNLAAHEIVGQVVAVREHLAATSPGARITGVVFMGQGEPLHNYDAVIQAARVLSDPCGGRIDARNISISTVGLVPHILRYAREHHKYRLVISLHSAIQTKRESFLPVAHKHALPELADAIRVLHRETGDRVTIAWCLMGGINDGGDEVDALRALLSDVPLRINLIDVNDARTAAEGGFRTATPMELKLFVDALQVMKQPVVRRYSGGKVKHAACGMLASTS
jgi:23S rRNA (adenine2503-C2)-methyltransferase